MPDFKTLDVTHDNGLTCIVLRRPSDANAVDRTLAAELALAAHECAASRDTRAVLLTGEGRFFCAGGDIKAMASFGTAVGSEVKLLVEDFHQAISSFARMSAPVVVAVNGPTAGAGFSLAVAGDLVLAAETATFTLAYTAAGLSPDGSSSYYLPRLIGLRRAQELMLTNRQLSAQEAAVWGLVNQVVTPAELLTTATRLARKLACGSLESHAYVKKLLLASFDNGLETQMALEARAIAACAASPDGQEGVRAFLGKRAPRFHA
jgi:2-(1,2-epoxy-1,2-dihydrophenyl)acetyl-CoA isomerase